MSSDELVEVYRAHGEAEAQVIVGLLKSSGIPCLVRSHSAPSVHPFTVNGLGEYRVMVPRASADAARELVRGTEDA